MNGTYKEKLPSGGELVVEAQNWHISYYFPGPDLRYNGTFFTIPGNEIDKYIAAWRNNFKKYLELKATYKLDGESSIEGEKGMTIHVSKTYGGVSIDHWHFRISSQRELDNVLKDYHIAKHKAKIIMQAVSSINEITVDLTEDEFKPEPTIEDVAFEYGNEDEKIAAAYNKIFHLRDNPFTKKQALNAIGESQSDMFSVLIQNGLVLYNEEDDDYSILDKWHSKDGANWILDYYLRRWDPLFLDFAELFIIKNKRNIEYLSEKLDIPHSRAEKIYDVMKEFNLTDTLSYFERDKSLREIIIDKAYEMFYTPLPL